MGWSEKKADERAAWRERWAGGTEHGRNAVAAYKTAKVPRSRWDLSFLSSHTNLKPCNPLNSRRALKVMYRSQAQQLGGKHTRNPLKRALRRKMKL